MSEVESFSGAARSALAADGKVFREKGISKRALAITVSAIKEMPMLAARLGGCVSLGQGIPSFATPEHIREAVIRTLREDPDCGKYTLGPGMPALRAAAADWLRAAYGVPADPETEVLVTVGAMEGLLAAILTVVEPRDEVIMPGPNYASHIEQVLLAGGTPVFAPLRPGDWSLDLDAVRAALTPRSKAIIVCTPHNPTGAVFGRDELTGLAELAAERDLFVISDETYEFLTYDGNEHTSLAAQAALKDRVIACFSFSKKYAMTGWRVGFVYAGKGILDHVMKVHDAGAICAPAVSQHAALAALSGPQDCVREIKAGLAARRDLICERLDDLGPRVSYVRPAGAYYLLAGFDLGLDSMTLALRLLKEARVVTIPGGAFGPGGEGKVRMSFGGEEAQIVDAMDRVAAWLDRQS